MEKQNFILYFFLLPASAILLVTWLLTYWKWKIHAVLYFLIALWGLFFVAVGAEPYLKPATLTKADMVGKYVIDQDQFPGKQADWQYDNFRFTITDRDELIFESRIHEDRWKSEKIKISYTTGGYDLNVDNYCNRRIIVHSDSSNHHIVRSNPTLYRKRFNRFYYVFESEKFGNVFFKKGEWE